MSSPRRALRLSFVAFFFSVFSLLPALGANVEWKVREHRGQKYVPLEQVKEFYKFTSMKKVGSYVVLERGKAGSDWFVLKFSAGGQEVLMNGVKFIFSYPIVPLGGYHISVLDLRKVVDPILNPAEINKGAKVFDTVIIDPGHGGKDAGAVNSLGTEAGYNLKVAQMLYNNLKKRGFKVVMTRKSDVYLSLSQRVQFANKYQNAIFISIHFNSAGSTGRSRARGIETFTLSPKGVPHYGRSLKASDNIARNGNAQDSANIALATTVHWGALKFLNKETKAGNKIPDRGVRRARYSVLTSVKHPAILFEGGFMSHPKEKYLINSPAYQQILARSICEAVCLYRKATVGQIDRRNAQKR